MFMIKKAFFDLWDHFLPAILINLGFIAVLAIPMTLPSAVSALSPVLGIAVVVIGVVAVFVYSAAAAMVARDISDYETPEWSNFWGYLKESWPAGLALGAIYVLHGFLISVAVPVYGGMDSVLGLAALAFLFWASVIWVIASLFYFPIRSRLDTKISRILKKCFIVFFDNTGFAIYTAFGAAVIALLSLFTAFLLPGITGMLIWMQVGFKLRLYKYDYLEEHPDSNKRSIPWDALLLDDRDRVGKRTLRGMIFPWKE